MKDKVQKKLAALKSHDPNKWVWAGPMDPSNQGGITYSLLCKFINCRERFRLLVCEGLKPQEEFSSRMEYGNMFHLCEETTLKGEDWKDALNNYCISLTTQYPLSREEITKWWNVCKLQYPIYKEYWKNHDDGLVNHLEPEHIFHVPWQLPSGRTVYLRGKIDSSKKEKKRYFLQENKTKGEINQIEIERQLHNNLQTNFYVLVLSLCSPKNMQFGGVIYNIVKRPLSGGKGTIRQKQNEEIKEYYERLRQVLEENKQESFCRFKVEYTKDCLLNFLKRLLDPLLEGLCDWWEWMVEAKAKGLEPWGPLHWEHPYGIFNAVNEGYYSDIDRYMHTGEMIGLRKTENLFPELSIQETHDHWRNYGY